MKNTSEQIFESLGKKYYDVSKIIPERIRGSNIFFVKDKVLTAGELWFKIFKNKKRRDNKMVDMSNFEKPEKKKRGRKGFVKDFVINNKDKSIDEMLTLAKSDSRFKGSEAGVKAGLKFYYDKLVKEGIIVK